MAQTLPAPFAVVRSIVESAPPSIRPLMYHAAAVFLKREEPRWATLTPHLTEERFLNFLECPSSWDLVREHLTEDGGAATGGAPANAAGNGGVAGIGQPEGSYFGQPPGRSPLDGATTKTKKKNKKPEDLKETAYVWECGKCGKIYGPAPDVSKKCPRCGSSVATFKDDSELDEELSKDDIEKAAAEVHNRWVDHQKKSGHTEHKSPDGKEDYMVPYDKLKDKSKQLDREAVKATVDVLGLDEATDDHKNDIRQDCWVCDGKGLDWGETCVTCGGVGWYWVDKKTGKFSDYALNEERETFAGGDVFEVDTDRWMKSRFGKNRYHRYSRYVGSDAVGEEIRQHGRGTKRDIILKDQQTGAMSWLLRRKKPGA